MKFDVAYADSPESPNGLFFWYDLPKCPHGFRFNPVGHGYCSGIGPGTWCANQGRALEGELETDVGAARAANPALSAQDRVPYLRLFSSGQRHPVVLPLHISVDVAGPQCIPLPGDVAGRR